MRNVPATPVLALAGVATVQAAGLVFMLVKYRQERAAVGGFRKLANESIDRLIEATTPAPPPEPRPRLRVIQGGAS